jgi:hypothetical protein
VDVAGAERVRCLFRKRVFQGLRKFPGQQLAQ